MSTLESKLAYAPPEAQTPARRTLKSLRACHGFVVLQTAKDGTPVLVRTDVMESTWAWRLVSGKGPESLWELAYSRGGENAD